MGLFLLFSPLQLISRTLRLCFTEKLQKCSVDYENHSFNFWLFQSTDRPKCFTVLATSILGGAGIQTNDLPITRPPALPPELKPPLEVAHFKIIISLIVVI